MHVLYVYVGINGTEMAAKKQTHRSLPISFKIRAVELAETTSKSKAARELNVDVRRVREWCKNNDKLLTKKKCGQSTKKRLHGGGRKAAYEDMEEI